MVVFLITTICFIITNNVVNRNTYEGDKYSNSFWAIIVFVSVNLVVATYDIAFPPLWIRLPYCIYTTQNHVAILYGKRLCQTKQIITVILLCIRCRNESEQTDEPSSRELLGYR